MSTIELKELLSSLEVPTRATENWKYSNPRKIIDREYTLNLVNTEFKEDDVGGLVKSHHPFALHNLSHNQNQHVVTKDTRLSLGLKNNEYTMDYIQVTVDEGQSIKIDLDFFNNDDSACFHNQVIEIYLKENASLTFYNKQSLNNDSSLIQHIVVNQQPNSHFYCFTLDIGGSFVRHDIDVDLAGDSAVADLNGYYQTNGKQHVDNHSEIIHNAKHCNSVQRYKGVIQDQSHAVFNGKALINKGSDKASVEQLNNNLLLSKTAEIDTKPELEIYADDVTAAHGATVGQLDQDALFYLLSRGYTNEDAIKCLQAGFVREVFETIPHKEKATALLNELGYQGDY